MPKTRDDRKALDAFIRVHSYRAKDGLIVKGLLSHPVHARSDRGNAAAYFHFPGLKALEAHVSELPARAAAGLHRHSCEAIFYVLKGEGYTVIHKPRRKERRIAWKEGDLFTTPIGLWHQHFNASTRSVARYLEITTIPLMKSLGAWFIESKFSKGRYD
jgi:mannose-6-phosphate isomerase-like protein (cupin superfamily)